MNFGYPRLRHSCCFAVFDSVGNNNENHHYNIIIKSTLGSFLEWFLSILGPSQCSLCESLFGLVVGKLAPIADFGGLEKQSNKN